MGDFSDQLRKFAEKTGAKMETVVRKTILDLQTSVVNLSPVDTGRFRANWMTGIGSANKATVTVEDKSGAVSLARVDTALAGWAPGQTIWLTNALPYAARLEYGWSKQAPGGMVRLTVQNFQDYVSKAVAEVR